ncbi:M23 family metallopeptidase [Streptomyces smyrnaeus]|uniref:M23 family metallopeptidase n=1 Tax=Streptomyces TaxID=1883 RepID=UPI000C1A5697|nr:M23 family metallopeptidase [Streptomyces sp. RK75]MBQ0868208.1 M23 family metallopeptidase [Streptomyces sp. RK75]MBQ1157546.1 M23 family metallopeptidase [Streptomyces sp. A73]
MTMSRTTKRARTYTTALAAGLGATMALGAGTALAAAKADAGTAQHDIFATGTASSLAESTKAQADAHRKAAEAAAKAKERAAEAKKRAAQKAARDAERLQTSWIKPIDGKYELSASYGKAGGRWAHNHSGQDFAVSVGTPVQAVHKGTVVKAGPNGAGDGPAYGNAIVVRHDNGAYSQYAHLSQINVKPGQQIKTGQTIAESGNTGNSSGPHLHFEIRKGPNYGTAVDPQAAMRAVGVTF